MMTMITEDLTEIAIGQKGWNYYDMELVTLASIDSHPQPDGTIWADWKRENGQTMSLDGQRVCSLTFAIEKGWYSPSY